MDKIRAFQFSLSFVSKVYRNGPHNGICIKDLFFNGSQVLLAGHDHLIALPKKSLGVRLTTDESDEVLPTASKEFQTRIVLVLDGIITQGKAHYPRFIWKILPENLTLS